MACNNGISWCTCNIWLMKRTKTLIWAVVFQMVLAYCFSWLLFSCRSFVSVPLSLSCSDIDPLSLDLALTCCPKIPYCPAQHFACWTHTICLYTHIQSRESCVYVGYLCLQMLAKQFQCFALVDREVTTLSWGGNVLQTFFKYSLLVILNLPRWFTFHFFIAP